MASRRIDELSSFKALFCFVCNSSLFRRRRGHSIRTERCEVGLDGSASVGRTTWLRGRRVPRSAGAETNRGRFPCLNRGQPTELAIVVRAVGRSGGDVPMSEVGALLVVCHGAGCCQSDSRGNLNNVLRGWPGTSSSAGRGEYSQLLTLSCKHKKLFPKLQGGVVRGGDGYHSRQQREVERLPPVSVQQPQGRQGTGGPLTILRRRSGARAAWCCMGSRTHWGCRCPYQECAAGGMQDNGPLPSPKKL